MQLGSITSRIDKMVAAGAVAQVASTTSLPAGVKELSIEEAEKLYGSPWYKKWWVWAIAGGVVAGGVTLTVFMKRRR
jgi:hypothetical protein